MSAATEAAVVAAGRATKSVRQSCPLLLGNEKKSCDNRLFESFFLFGGVEVETHDLECQSLLV